jgi:hypothetical protein
MLKYSLFFTAYHQALVHTLRMMLRPDGQVLIVGPSRGTTMIDFKAKAELFFTCKVDNCQTFKEIVD